MKRSRGKRSYFTDDTLRTIGLFARATSAVEPGLLATPAIQSNKPDHGCDHQRATES
jgi:hypothetical protein